MPMTVSNIDRMLFLSETVVHTQKKKILNIGAQTAFLS